MNDGRLGLVFGLVMLSWLCMCMHAGEEVWRMDWKLGARVIIAWMSVWLGESKLGLVMIGWLSVWLGESKLGLVMINWLSVWLGVWLGESKLGLVMIGWLSVWLGESKLGLVMIGWLSVWLGDHRLSESKLAL